MKWLRSFRKLFTRPHLGGAAASAALVIAFPLQTAAKEVKFDPLFVLGAFYNQNVLYVGEDGPSDSGFRLRIVLPVQISTRRSTTTFTYQPVFTAFSSFDELNNLGHRVTLANRSQVSQVSEFSALAEFRLTQEQGDPDSDEEIDSFLDPRTERRQGRVNLGYRRQLSPLWSAFAGVRALRIEFQPILDLDTEEPIVDPEDRNTLRGTVWLARALSERTGLGLEYSATQFDLERSGKETSQIVWLRLDHSISPESNFLLQLGGYTREQEQSDDSTQGFSGRITFNRALNRHTAFRLFGRVEPTAGTSLPSTVIYSTLGVGLSSTALRNWVWSLAARYSREDPTEESLATREVMGVSAFVSRRAVRYFWVNARATYNYQRGSATSRNFRALLELQWRPLEKRAGGS